MTAALLSGAGVHAQTQAFVLKGRVTSVDGAGVSAAHLRIVELNQHTDAGLDGSYTFEGVPAGSYLLEARSSRFGAKVVRVVSSSTGFAPADFVLSVAAHEEAVIVTAGAEQSALDEIARPASVLGGLDLGARLKPTIGDTLAEQPGVAATSFAPGASRPVIRGLGGERIRILNGGVGSADASNTSPDHAVSFDPLSATQIEVLRGPATLLYGSTAIGGVVNIIDTRIPESRPGHPITGIVDMGLGSVSDEKQGGASLTGGRRAMAWHVDGLARDTRNVDVPTEAGTLANSATRTGSGSVGFSAVGSQTFFGINGSIYDTEYGVPSEEDVSIDLRQKRLDIKGGIQRPVGPLRGIRLRVGIADYGHRELEGSEVGTKLDTSGFEGRLEVAHKPIGAMRGAVGVQVGSRDMAVEGEEAFLPQNETRSFAAFALEEFGRGAVRLTMGGRVEHQTARVVDGTSRDRTGVSGSLGLTARHGEDLTLGVSLAHSERLPGAEELFSNGPHAATSAFEIGDPGLGKERSLGLDASLKFSRGRFSFEGSVFRNAFDGYIFERLTGEEKGGLRIVRYEQRDARFWGFESEASWNLLAGDARHLSFEGSIDYVRASIAPDSAALPRIPPLRIGARLHYRDQRVDLRGEVRRVMPQDRVDAFESETPGYTTLNATASYRIFGGSRTLTDLVLRATNLGNVLARNHVSYLKDVAPLPGRDVRISVRFQF